MIPDFIKNRIKQSPIHDDIVKKSTPIVFFGNIHTAKVGTISLNPSDKEFNDKNGKLLGTGAKRFHDLESLEAASLESLTDIQVEKVFNFCLNYFDREGAQPYKKWFGSIEKLIKESLDISYYDGSCCHLDIIQWATKPVWRGLKPYTITNMLQTDLPFLKQLIINSNIELLLINGKSTLANFKEQFADNIISGTVIDIETRKDSKLKVEKGLIKINEKEIKYIGWNLYKQSAISKEDVQLLTSLIKNNFAN